MKHLYVAADLIEAAGLAEIGMNLFVNTMPHDVHSGVMLRDPLYGAELDAGMDGFVKHDFMVIARDAKPDVAWQLAKSVGDALNVTNVTRDGIFIRQMYPLTLPVSYPKMDSDELETSVRIRVTFALV